MSLQPSSTFRRGAFALTTAAALAIGSVFPAYGQAVMAATPPTPATRTLSDAECAVFGQYLVEEAKLLKKDMSREFLLSAGRFIKSGCRSKDANGDIQIVTMTDADGAGLRTALRLMGSVDVLGSSGVAHCHRPPAGVCPTTVGSARNPRAGS